MSDYHNPTDDSLPSLSIQIPQPRQRSTSEAMAPEDTAGQATTSQDTFSIAHRSRTSTPAPDIAPTQSTIDPVLMKQVEDVLSSEQGIPTLLSCLKQSISSAKDYASFLKKRASLEDDHAQSLKKLCRLTQESLRKPDHRQGSFAHAYDEVTQIHERMAENGIQFSASLYQMQEELLELIGSTERLRKMWKTNGLAAEQKVVDLEQAMRKSKIKYDSLAEEFDRARTGEAKSGGGKMLFKAHKSAAQHEEELLKKVQTADQTYHNHVISFQHEKAQLQTSIRPEAVKALREAVAEIDAGVAMQMQKFASLVESILLGNGLIISPFKSSAGSTSYQPRSLRQAVASIDNEKDLNEFLASSHIRVQPHLGEIKYERNAVLNPQGRDASSQMQAAYSPQHPMGQNGQRSTSISMPQGAPLPLTQGILAPANATNTASPTSQQIHNRSFSQGNMMNLSAPPAPQYSPNSNMTPGGSRYAVETSSQPSNLPVPGQRNSPQQSLVPFQPAPPSHASGGSPNPVPAGSNHNSLMGITRPVFGVHLGRLYERDGLAVPMVVYQCIQAVDLFGLGVEGIYRQSGSMNHITRLKTMFDSEPQGQSLDFRNPENFYHDVNSVTGLLKQFFRDLPDPLLTMEHHSSFINAAKHEDDIVRRDSLHAIINSLPDPNYATLRAMMLHLHRVMDNSHINRMNSHNLAVILGPTLMGTDPSMAIADAGWQIKVIDTILKNTYQIFDED